MVSMLQYVVGICGWYVVAGMQLVGSGCSGAWSTTLIIIIIIIKLFIER